MMKKVTTANSFHSLVVNAAHGLQSSIANTKETVNATPRGLLFGAFPAAALTVSTAATTAAIRNRKISERSTSAFTALARLS